MAAEALVVLAAQRLVAEDQHVVGVEAPPRSRRTGRRRSGFERSTPPISAPITGLSGRDGEGLSALARSRRLPACGWRGWPCGGVLSALSRSLRFGAQCAQPARALAIFQTVVSQVAWPTIRARTPSPGRREARRRRAGSAAAGPAAGDRLAAGAVRWRQAARAGLVRVGAGRRRPSAARARSTGANIELLTWGEVGKPGLILVHGNSAHADWWSFIAPFLADDLPRRGAVALGHGRLATGARPIRSRPSPARSGNAPRRPGSTRRR